MSSTYVVFMLLLVIALLIIMVGKLKFHAVLALFIATVIYAYSLRNDKVELNPAFLNEDETTEKITMGLSNLAAYLAMCSGAIAFSHANSSGFWLTASLANLDFKQGLKSIGGSTLVSGLACCAFTLILYFAGII